MSLFRKHKNFLNSGLHNANYQFKTLEPCIENLLGGNHIPKSELLSLLQNIFLQNSLVGLIHQKL